MIDETVEKGSRDRAELKEVEEEQIGHGQIELAWSETHRLAFQEPADSGAFSSGSGTLTVPFSRSVELRHFLRSAK